MNKKEYEKRFDELLKRNDFLDVEEVTEIDFIQPKKTVGKLISVDVLDKIRADVINIADGRRSIPIRSVIKIINKYRK